MLTVCPSLQAIQRVSLDVVLDTLDLAANSIALQVGE